MAPLDPHTDYYGILGVSPDCSPGELKRQYHLSLHRVHPDHGGDARQTHLVMQAYRVLSDPQARQRYDRIRRPAANPAAKTTRMVLVVDDQRTTLNHVRWALYGSSLTPVAVHPHNLPAMMSLFLPEAALVGDKHLSVAEQLRKRGIPVVILVEKTNWSGVIRAANAGYHHLLLKPFTTRGLMEKISAALVPKKKRTANRA